jgi:AP-3 complex subunit mu
MSGIPDLTLIFNTPGVIEDCSFHPCVRYARWERENVVSFVPPDGPFTLMNYRITERSASLPIGVRALAGWRDGIGKATFSLTTKPMTIRSASGAGASLVGAGDVSIEDVKLTVTVPKAVKSTDFTADMGHVAIDSRTNDINWNVRSFPREKSPELAGTLFLPPGVPSIIESVSATLQFTATGQTASGLSVKDLILSSEKYQFFKGVRTILRSGRVQVRT